MIEVQEVRDSLLERKEAAIEKYKKRLLRQVIIIFGICLILILERVFYQLIIDAEEDTLSSFQQSLNLTKVKNNTYLPKSIDNAFLKFYGDISKFQIKFLILTHVLCTLYVAVDAFLASKLLYTSMIVLYFISFLQIFYAGPRPFWATQKVLSSSCLASYNHPSTGLVLMLFVPFYGYYCWKKKSYHLGLVGSYGKHVFFVITVIIFTGVVQFMNYMIGITYIINIAMSLVVCALLFMLIFSGDSLLDKAIIKSTILKTDAKKYIFYWFLLIVLLYTFILIIYSGENMFLNIQWVQNYMDCTRYLKYPQKVYKYDEVIGPWFNLNQFASLFGWIGAVFGISACFRSINNVEWAKGPLKYRILRALIANAFIIPSWIFNLYLQPNGTWIKDIGLNTLIIGSVHYLILYFWLFGYMPILLFKKALKIIPKNEEPDEIFMSMAQR